MSCYSFLIHKLWGWEVRFVTLPLLLVLVPYVTASGQSAPGPQARQLERQPVNQWPANSKRFALVIGVDQYADTQISTLGGAANDAKSLAETLVRFAGFPRDQVTVLASDQPVERHPTRGNILRRLSNLATVIPPDGLFLMSFSGHGLDRGGEAFLLPADAQWSNDVELLEQTGINVKEINRRIRKIGVGQVVIIIDACRNDPEGRATTDNPLTTAFTRGFDFDLRNRDVTAFATLYATSVNHSAYEFQEKHQGYFTWELIEALKGGAANENGEITLAGVVSYVQEHVPRHVLIDLGAGKDQRPFAVIEGYRADKLVIAVAKPHVSVVQQTSGATALDAATIELSYWETIKTSTNPEDFRAYLRKYPDGQFADLARNRAQPRTEEFGDQSQLPKTASNFKTAYTLKVRVGVDTLHTGWVSSGLVVRRGNRLRITATGRILLGDNSARNKNWSTPTGIQNLSDKDKLLHSEATGALIAVIGDDNDLFFLIGAKTEFVAQRNGALYLGVNQGGLPVTSGAYDVTIEVEAGSTGP